MTPEIARWLRRVRRTHPFVAGRVLEVGSMNVNGTPRRVFRDAEEYIGVDACAGRGVDRVMDAERLAEGFGVGTFDIVVCCEVLEHVRRPFIVSEQMRSVLRPGGWMIVTSPEAHFPIHRFPRDYYRLLPDAYEDIVFAGMEIIASEQVGNSDDHQTLCYLGRKP